ncbi:hypothetical protein C8Q74DRAFT_1437494 [Fomes fomentarius]|nr:hypothetical protein C8Q74DRAFT_1437494 [Fomes fomentarius]
MKPSQALSPPPKETVSVDSVARPVSWWYGPLRNYHSRHQLYQGTFYYDTAHKQLSDLLEELPEVMYHDQIQETTNNGKAVGWCSIAYDRSEIVNKPRLNLKECKAFKRTARHYMVAAQSSSRQARADVLAKRCNVPKYMDSEAPSGRSTPAVDNLRPPTLFPPREGFFFEACVPSTPVSQLYDALDLDEGNSELNSVRELDQESIAAEVISLTAPPTQVQVQPNFASSFDSRPRIIRRCSSHPSF